MKGPALTMGTFVIERLHHEGTTTSHKGFVSCKRLIGSNEVGSVVHFCYVRQSRPCDVRVLTSHRKFQRKHKFLLSDKNASVNTDFVCFS